MEGDHGGGPPDHLQPIEDGDRYRGGPSHPDVTEFDLSAGGINLEETIREVKDRVLSIGDATMRGIAELLMGFGVSPEIIGYTEEDFIDEKYDEGRASRTGNKEAVIASSSYAQRTMTSTHQRRSEDVSLLNRPMWDGVAEGDAVDQRGQEFDERRGLLQGRRGSDEEEYEYEEDKKDK